MYFLRPIFEASFFNEVWYYAEGKKAVEAFTM